MKQTGLFLLLAHLCLLADAQFTWTWLNGSNQTPKFGVYGTRGVADSANVPGFRTGEASWTDSDGNTWLFGGRGNSRNGTGVLNDLWKFTKATGTWTWISGDQDINQFGRYGKKGIADAANMIGCRAYANTWVDKQGNFWFYGGEGYDNFTVNTPAINLSDFWKFDPKTTVWTWMGGDTTYRFKIVYPSVWNKKGIPAATTYPGSRLRASTWIDDNDNLWLFGGSNYSTVERSLGNGLWSYSISSGLWTWVGGDTTSNQSGNYGVKGVASPTNLPAARDYATSWKDKNGDFFLFGGRDFISLQSYFGDLWKFSPASGLWTWLGGSPGNNNPVYGTAGTSSPTSQPGSRAGAVKWIDQSDNVWIYAGLNSAGYFNDVWKYTPGTNDWTWIQGIQGKTTNPANYGTKGTFSVSNIPAAAENFSAWTDNGTSFFVRSSNQLWKFDPFAAQWAWLGGDTTAVNDLSSKSTAVYGQKGIFAPANTPGFRKYAMTWTDPNSTLWLFGGETNIISGFNDLWKYSQTLNQWAWMGGDTLFNQPGKSGPTGIPADSLRPAAQSAGMSWTDPDGNLLLFGGTNNMVTFAINFWKYTIATGQWTLISSKLPSFGTVGVASPNNYPGSFQNSVTWKDKAGNPWFFGGGSQTFSNQLWKYDIATATWTCMYGNSNPLANPTRSGTKGVNDGRIDGRIGASSWTDSSGNFWLFGGSSFKSGVGELDNNNDLWKYSPTSRIWTWVAGDNVIRKKGVYGQKGIPGTNTTPGARRNAKTWTDGQDNLYLFGGTFDTTFATDTYYFNDVWKYNISANQWTWIGGDSTLNHWGVYGTAGIPMPQNQPGSREGSSTWSNGTGRFWIFSGFGNADNGRRSLNDMMMFDPAGALALPVQFSQFSAYKKEKSVQLAWTTAQEFNAREFIIERSSDGRNFSETGRVGASGTTTFSTSYSFTDINPLIGNNYYRLKEVDFNNRIMYSEVRMVSFSDSKAAFTIMGNPVVGRLKLSINMPYGQRASVQIRNETGQFLSERTFRLETGVSVIQVPLPGVSKGNYIVVISSESLNQSRNFMIR